MAETVILRNRARRPLVLNLPHGLVPEAATMGVVGTRDHDATLVSGPKDVRAPGAGARRTVAHRRPVSGSVTLTARGCPEKGDAKEVPRSALQAPDVIAARAAGDVVVEDPPEPAQETPAPPESPAAPPRAAKKPAPGAAKDTE